MKKIFSLTVAIICFYTVQAQYKITLQAPQYKTGIAYLTYHLGKNLNIQDSGIINDKGVMIFTGNKKLPGGIYAIVFPGKNLSLDFLIDSGINQTITIKATDTTDLLNKTVITGSPANILFDQYQKALAPKGKLLENERKAYVASTTKADSALHEANYVKYNKELTDFREAFIQKYPNAMLVELLKAMRDPKLLMQKPLTRQDSLDNYNYYKAHYWDNVTFMDERIIRTPFFEPRLVAYYEKVVSQEPDSITASMDYQLLLARSCPEMYKYLLNWFTDEFFYPKYMGQDAILVHLFEKYHSQGLSPWLSKKQEDLISNRAYMEMSNLLGAQGANLNLIDSTGKMHALYDINADYTLVVFWEPSCGHCKTQIPKIDSIYEASWKKHNLKVYAVLTEDKTPEWTKFILDNHLTDWTNVYQTKEMASADEKENIPGFRQLYDVTSTPTLYLLDKDKRILVKHLSWDQINDFLIVKWAAAAKAESDKLKK
jgi:thiol-disulfide isomerase/thioredoxin